MLFFYPKRKKKKKKSLLYTIFIQTTEQSNRFILLSFSTCKKVICFYAISIFKKMHHFRIDYSASLGKLPVLLCPSHMQGSNMLLYNLSIQLFDYLFICIIFAQTMEQGKYPYSYVFFNMQGSNMLLCNLSIHFFFLTLLCIIFTQTMEQGKYPYFYVFSTCKEVICFYAISLSFFLSTFMYYFHIDHGAR